MNQIYVETTIRADLDEIWHRSQDPSQHQRWDLRFTHIDYLPKVSPNAPQEFRYATTFVPGFGISGIGISSGERRDANGNGTSALRFASDHPLSPIVEGSGYWRYVPTAEGTRFFTGYSYRARWGRPGAVLDDLVVRPLMGWATAWSFDRLRLWLERGITPERLRLNALLDAGARGTGLAVGAALLARSPGWFGRAAGGALMVASLTVPPAAEVPAARRCVRTPQTPVKTPDLLHRLRPL
ncbi:hypothetical protein JT358_13615 [Micrococcales bacterium 31B]|nr:hypothetical protein [Micrococcales bacterium 31B]